MIKQILHLAIATTLILGLVSCKKSYFIPGEWVDLGLPSGLLWYSVNLGATSPEGYGNYYAWGETSTKSDYSWSTYAYGRGYYQLTKYCGNSSHGLNGFTDNLTTLQAADDAATVVLGRGARIPTIAEWQELVENTSSEWMTLNGVYCLKLTASNGNSLFLPAAGYWEGSEPYRGECGYYWSSLLNTDDPANALCVDLFYHPYARIWYDDDDCVRHIGLPVRAVRSMR